MRIIGLAGPARTGKNAISDYMVEHYGYQRYAFADPLYEEVAEAFDLGQDLMDWLRSPEEKELPKSYLSLYNCADHEFVEACSKVEGYNGHEFMLEPRSLRWILQWWGTEYRRAQDEQYWIKKADEFLAAYLKRLEHVVTKEEFELEVAELKEVECEYPEASALPVGSVWYHEHPGIVVEGVRFENEVDWIRSLNGQVWHIERPDAPSIGDAVNHVSASKLEMRTGDKLIINGSTLERLYTGVTLALQGNDIVNTGDEANVVS